MYRVQSTKVGSLSPSEPKVALVISTLGKIITYLGIIIIIVPKVHIDPTK